MGQNTFPDPTAPTLHLEVKDDARLPASLDLFDGDLVAPGRSREVLTVTRLL